MYLSKETVPPTTSANVMKNQSTKAEVRVIVEDGRYVKSGIEL